MKYKILFFVILLAGIALRLYHVWTAPYAYVGPDIANIWLMSKHMMEGEFPLFFYGQYYLGPLEPFVTAIFFKIFGINRYTLYLGTVFFSGLFIMTSYFLGKLIGDKKTGLFVMLYSAMPPVCFFKESVIPFGYHIELPLLGTVILILAIIIPTQKQPQKKTVLYYLIGIVSGIGFWLHYIIIYYLFAAGIYLFIKERFKGIFYGLAGFFISSMPFWIFTFRYDFATFRFKSLGGETLPVKAVFGMFLREVSDMFNLGFGLDSPFRLAASLLFLAAIVVFTINAVKRFNKKTIFVFFLAAIIIFYTAFKSSLYSGIRHDYLLPLITFGSVCAGFFCWLVFQKSKAVGSSVLIVFVLYNLIGITETIDSAKGFSLDKKNMLDKKLQFYRENNISRIFGDEGCGRAYSFFSGENIITANFMDSRYHPYEDEVESADSAALTGDISSWTQTLENICKDYKYKEGLFFDFRQFPYKARYINPKEWKGNASDGSINTEYAFDRNYDFYWSSIEGKKKGLSYTVDLGSAYELCKIDIYNGHRQDSYPEGLRIEVSADGNSWNTAAVIENTQPMFWSGPRIYWRLTDGRMEWYIKPVTARYLRLSHIGEKPWSVWEINELIIYEYEGEQDTDINIYKEDIVQAAGLFKEKNVDFVYADFWPSAKIREITKGKIEALVPFNSFMPPRKNMNREIILTKHTGFMIDNEDAGWIEEIFSEFGLHYEKTGFKRYKCYYFPDLGDDYKKINSLLWIGIGILKRNLKSYSGWLYEHGEHEKALDYYNGNFLAWQKYKKYPAFLYCPDTENNIIFKNGIRFLGYTVKNKNIKPGTEIDIDYFWEVINEPAEDLDVFVYFMKNGKIFFQNDHKLLCQFGKPINPLNGERFREQMKVAIPPNISHGTYDIIIGLWDVKKGIRVNIFNSSGDILNKKKIGELNILDYET